MLVRKTHVEPYRQLGLPAGTIANTERLQYQPLHVISKSAVAVAYRDGQEVEDVGDSRNRKGKNSAPPEDVLATSGEFGPILAVVFTDATKGKITWSHWEQGGAGPNAVFHYEVPQDKSHFLVAYKAETENQFPAYHGEITIDPATGTVLRITMISDIAPPYQGVKTGIVVEYAPVTIGEQSYSCPVRSVSFSRMPVVVGGRNPQASPAPLQTRINDVAFTQYHLLRAESHIVSADNAGSQANPPTQAAVPEPTAPPASFVAPTAAPSDSASAPVVQPSAIATPVEQPAPSISTANSAPGPSANSTPAQAQTSPPASQDALSAASTPVPTPAPAPFAAEAQSSVLHVESNLVLLDVVVTKRDKPVEGLDQKRFHIFVDGKEQVIAAFDEHRAQAAPAPVERPSLPPNTYTNVPIYPEASAATVLLLDGLNTPATDQINLRQQMIDYLGKIKPGTKIAIFTMGRQLRMASNFTTDIGEVMMALNAAKSAPQQSGPLGAQTLTQDANAASNTQQGITGTAQPNGLPSDQPPPSTSPMTGPLSTAQVIQAFQAESNSFQTDMRVDLTLDALQQLARSLSVIPLRKNVIWFSASFPFRIDPDMSLGTAAFDSTRDYYDQVEKTTQLLSDARIAIYPVDARGLTVRSQFNAAQRGPVSSSQGMQEQLQHDQEHGTMNEIADATGGKAYYETNGLMDAVTDTLDQGSNYYTLGYVPHAKESDGQFHKFNVKLDGESGNLTYRSGYFADLPDQPSAHHPAEKGLITASRHGLPEATQIAFQARILPATDRAFQGVVLPDALAGDMALGLKTPAHRYVVDLLVDPHGLIFEPAPDGAFVAFVDFALAAYDSDGDRVNYLYRASQVKVSHDRYEATMASGFRNRLIIDLPEGDVSLRIVVHDLKADRAGSLEVPLTVLGR
jgi:VWFA-related protein